MPGVPRLPEQAAVGAWNTWDGTEFVSPSDTNSDSVAASTAAATDSTHPRIEPLDFSVSEDFDGNWARRHLESACPRGCGVGGSWKPGASGLVGMRRVLHRRLKAGEDDYWRFAEKMMCEAKRGPEFAQTHRSPWTASR